MRITHSNRCKCEINGAWGAQMKRPRAGHNCLKRRSSALLYSILRIDEWVWHHCPQPTNRHGGSVCFSLFLWVTSMHITPLWSGSLGNITDEATTERFRDSTGGSLFARNLRDKKAIRRRQRAMASGRGEQSSKLFPFPRLQVFRTPQDTE